MSNVERLAKKNNPIVLCKSCGANIGYNVRFCPHCGSSNEIGDELYYQEKLEDIREDLEELTDKSEDMIKDEATKFSKKILIVGIAVVAVLLVFGGAFLMYRSVLSRVRDSKNKSDIAWQKETYAKLDELYDNNDFEAIDEFYTEYYLSLEWEKHSLAFWKHDTFMQVYSLYAHLNDALKMLQNYPDSLGVERIDIFEDSVKLVMTDWDKTDYNKTLNEKDYENIALYRDFALKVLDEHYHLTADDLDNMFDELFDKEISVYCPDGNKCRNKAKELQWY